jgi:peptidoglycan-associated lipoprotein
MNALQRSILATAAIIALGGVGCAKKKAAAVTPPAPAAAPQQTASAQQPQPERRAATQPAPTTTNPSGPRFPDEKTRARIDTLLSHIEDAYFDYNQHSLRSDAIKTLEADSRELRDILRDYPDYKLTIEGHCDERGSADYNLALGDARAQAAKNYLVQVGIPAQQLGVISYGKERPICAEHDEACWQKNRRIHIVAMAK